MKRPSQFVACALVAVAASGCGYEQCNQNPTGGHSLSQDRHVFHPFSLSIDDHFFGKNKKLAHAAACGLTSDVADLITNDKANPSAVSKQGMPLLLWPVYKNNLAGFEALLENGADPNSGPEDGGIPMHYIIETGGIDFVRAALRLGADPNAINIDKEPLIHIARRVNRWDIIEALLDAGAEIDSFDRGVHSNTILDMAVGFGNFEKAFILLERGADPTFKLENALSPERIGAQPILEQIFHRPIDEDEYPEAVKWQRKCQEFVRKRGIKSPPIPEHLARSEKKKN